MCERMYREEAHYYNFNLEFVCVCVWKRNTRKPVTPPPPSKPNLRIDLPAHTQANMQRDFCGNMAQTTIKHTKKSYFFFRNALFI